MRDFVAKISLTALFVLAIFSASAAEKVTFEANSPLTVAVGEAFRVEFALNAKPDGDTFKAPSFEGFDVLAGPAISQGSSVQIVNGSMTKSVSYTYTFVLLPQAAGNVTIGAAEVKVDGSSYRTRPLPIEIVNEGEGSRAQQQQGGSNRADDTQPDAASAYRSTAVHSHWADDPRRGTRKIGRREDISHCAGGGTAQAETGV